MASEQDCVQETVPDPRKDELTALRDSRKAAWQLARAQQKPQHVIEALEALLMDAERQLAKPSLPKDVWSNVAIVMQTAENNCWDIATFPAITREQLEEVTRAANKRKIFPLGALANAAFGTRIKRIVIDDAALEDGGVYIITKRRPPSIEQLGDVNLPEGEQRQMKVVFESALKHAAGHLRLEGHKGVEQLPANLLDSIKLPVRPNGLVVTADQALFIQVRCCITVASVLQMAVTLAQLRQLQPGGAETIPELKGRSLSGALYGIVYTSNEEDLREIQRSSAHYGVQIWLHKPTSNGWVRCEGRSNDNDEGGGDRLGRSSWLGQLEMVATGVSNIMLGKGATGIGVEEQTCSIGLDESALQGTTDAQINASTALQHGAAGNKTVAATADGDADVDMYAYAYAYASLQQPSGYRPASTATHCMAAVPAQRWHRMRHPALSGCQADMSRLRSRTAASPMKCQPPKVFACAVTRSHMAPRALKIRMA